MNYFVFRLIAKALDLASKKYKPGTPVDIHSRTEGPAYTVRFAPVGQEPETVIVAGRSWSVAIPENATKEDLVRLKREVEALQSDLNMLCSEQIALIQHAEAQLDTAKRAAR